MTIILYLIGRPGTGKYTISKEIAKSGYILCDNHLINNVILSLLDLTKTIPSSAWDAIEDIRDITLRFIEQETQHNYIFTNVLYDVEYDHTIYQKIENMTSKRGSIFVPVKLHISEEENIQRIQNIERKNRFKSTDISDTSHSNELIQITHPNLLELDTSKLDATEAAKKILDHMQGLIF